MLRRFAATVVLPGVILLGFGLRALKQDRLATDQQVRDRLQRAAELAVREIDRQLSNWQQFRPESVDAERGAYDPADRMVTAAAEPALAEATQVEQVRGNIELAISLYRRAAATGSPHVRAAAFARLAVCYVKSGKRDEAIQAWRELLKYPDERIGAVPAEMIARYELCVLGQADRASFYHDLAGGRWKLDKTRYLFYSDTAREWVGESDPARAVEREKLGLSAAVEDFRENRRRLAGSYVAFWQGADSVIVPAAVLRARLERFAALDRDVAIRLVDVKAPRPFMAAYQALADRELPPAVVHRGDDTMMGWSPDGRRLMFASDRTGSMDLWSAPFADGKPQGEPELIKADIGRAEPMGFSRSSGLYLRVPVGARQHSSLQIASFDFDAGKLLSPLTDVTQEYLESNTLPSWSPDGKYFAYLSERGGAGSSQTVVVIRSVETNQVVRELRVKLSSVYSSQWAPDGRYLLVRGRNFKGQWGTYQADAQTGDVSLLVPDDPRRVLYPAWSPDGKSLYFSRPISGGKEMALIQRDLASGNEKELIRSVTAVADQVSPDGRYIAASTVDVPSRSRVKLLIPLAGGEPRELMRVPAGVEPGELGNYSKGTAVMCAQWATDSRSFLTFKRFNDEKRSNEVWRVPLDAGAPVKLDLKLDRCFGLSPDRRRIAIVVDEKGLPRGEEVWVLENFLPATAVKN